MTISTSPTTEILDAALALARRGWYLLPTSGKTPVLEDWPNAASNQEDMIRRWFGPDAIGSPNIGIAVGKSGLVVIDVDDLSVLGRRPIKQRPRVKGRQEQNQPARVDEVPQRPDQKRPHRPPEPS